MARAPTRGLYPFENTVLRIKAQPIFKKQGIHGAADILG